MRNEHHASASRSLLGPGWVTEYILDNWNSTMRKWTCTNKHHLESFAFNHTIQPCFILISVNEIINNSGIKILIQIYVLGFFMHLLSIEYLEHCCSSYFLANLFSGNTLISVYTFHIKLLMTWLRPGDFRSHGIDQQQQKQYPGISQLGHENINDLLLPFEFSCE